MLIVVQWYIEDLEKSGLVALKNVLYHKYVGFAGELRPGAPAIGVPHKRQWFLRREAQGLFRYYTIMYAHLKCFKLTGQKFFTPDSELNLELSGRGSDKGGTPVVLAIEAAGEKYQTWRIEEVS